MEGAMIVGIYLLPTFVVCACNKRNKWIIAVLNLLLGWTIIGWVVLLIASIFTGKSNEKEMGNSTEQRGFTT
jgi:RsiW-degrading membrane proteinase PrsW (M82 family)